MVKKIEAIISKAKQLAKDGHQNEAMSCAHELIKKHPDEMTVWALRGYLYELESKYIEAEDDITHAIEINCMEPHYFLTRGIYRFELDKNQLAVEDFTTALELCSHYNSNYYRDTLYFWRAETFLKMRKKKDALKDLAQVPEDFKFWTHQLRTKQDLINDCNQLP